MNSNSFIRVQQNDRIRIPDLKQAKIKSRKYFREKVIFEMFYNEKGKVSRPSGVPVLNCPS